MFMVFTKICLYMVSYQGVDQLCLGYEVLTWSLESEKNWLHQRHLYESGPYESSGANYTEFEDCENFAFNKVGFTLDMDRSLKGPIVI